MAEEIRPIRLKYESGAEYVLEFSAQTVKDAEGAGFVLGDVINKPMTLVPLLFFFAFKMHHPSISKKKTDEILFNDLGGISEAIQGRLIELYTSPVNTLVGDATPKNPELRVEM